MAVTWPTPATIACSTNAPFSVYDGQRLVSRSRVNQQSAPSDIMELGTGWKNLGFFQVSGDTLAVTLSDFANNNVLADAVRLQRIVGDGGPDNDFHEQPGSPLIDRGDPSDWSLAEPMPNGDRINLGAYGNTPEAATSPAEMIQVLAPNGPERFQQGEQVSIQWRSDGLLAARPTVLMNVGGGVVDNWRSDRYRTAGTLTSFTNPVDTSRVTNPAPEEVYRTLVYSENGIGKKVAYQIPVPNGDYTVRLHFVEPWVMPPTSGNSTSSCRGPRSTADSTSTPLPAPATGPSRWTSL